MPLKIITAQPGESWTNDTDKVWWQLRCSMINTCGYCLGFHMQIAQFWPIPFHRRCRCACIPVAPRQTAEPWVDFREMIKSFPPAIAARAFGRSVYRLIALGHISYEDAIEPGRVKSLSEIVHAKGLTVPKLVAAGISRGTAERAVGAMPEDSEAIQAATVEAKIENAGLTAEQVLAGITGNAILETQPQKPKIPIAAMIAGAVTAEYVRRLAKRLNANEQAIRKAVGIQP
jgi:hypothetical protein